MVSNRQIENPGRLVTYRSDFENHWTGTGFRHKANQIDVDPPLSFVPAHSDNVQDTMAAMLSLIHSGSDFVSIGDGVQSDGTYTIGLTYPTVEDCFAAALASDRLSHYGGFILLKSGFYNFTSTVNLPAGISVIGELGGTILNATFDSSIFSILECPSVVINQTHIAPPTVSADGYRISKLCNLTFFDNYGQNAAVLVSPVSCFVILQPGSNVEIDNCSFFGRYAGAGTFATMTRQAISLQPGVSSYNSELKVNNCVISSTQQALTYFVDTTKYNKLSFNNNRAWCTGIIGSGDPDERNVVLFNGCDAEFCNNDVKFGVGPIADANQSINSFVFCNEAPGALHNPATLIITGNRITATDTSALTVQNNLFTYSALINVGENFRSVVSGNTCTGSNDSNSWYIVVGDGITTVGDINGPKALSYIYSYYRQENVTANQTSSNLHEQITIFIKAGYYTIDGTSFKTAATNFAFKLIGLPHNGNLPRILLSIPAPAATGQPLYLGSHIENISFEADGNNLYYIMITDNYVQPNIPVLRPIYVKDIVVKNCDFNNTCIRLVSTASVVDVNFDGVILIEKCYFKVQDTFLNAVSTDVHAIFLDLPNYKVIIRDCATKTEFYGNFLYTRPDATYYNTDIIMENCFVDYWGNSSIATIVNSRNVILRENTFTLANFVPGTAIDTALFLYNSDTPLQQKESYALLQGNRFYGFDGASEFLIAYKIQGFSTIDIVDNILKNCPLGIYIDMSTDDAAIYPYNINIKSNTFIASANSYGFCSITALYNEPVGTAYLGTVNISNNNIDMSLKAATSNRAVALQSYYPNDAGAILLGVISVDLRSSNLDINNNTITSFSTDQATDQEALISCLRYKFANISSNTLELINSNNARNIYSIYAADNYPSTALVTNFNSVKITNNNINHIGDGVLVTNSTEQGITAINTKFIDIQYNTVKATDTCALTRFITGYAGTDDTDASIGTIAYNTIYSETAPGSAYLHENKDAITFYPVSVPPLVTVKMLAYRNKGQLFKKDINCYDFIQYGYNTDMFSTGMGSWAIFPATRATVLANKKTELFVLSDATNLNITEQMDIDGYIPAWNATLPKGLYYTNAFEKALDAFCDAGTPGGYKHQVLIPINIDDFVKLYEISIPIYLYNSGSAASTIDVSASLIICNTPDDITRITCVPGFAAPGDLPLWERRSKTLAATGDSDVIVLTHQFLDTSAGGSGNWLTPKYKVASGVLQSSAQAYIVLAMTTTGADTPPLTNMLFAIPGATVTFVY